MATQWRFELLDRGGGNSVPVIGCAPGAEPDSRTWWALIVVAAFLVVAPLWVTDVPPLLDYPSHLGRMVVLAASPSDAVRGIWEPAWSPIPNLAMDAVVLGLVQMLPLPVAGKIFVAAALLLPPLGTIALNRAIFRRRSWWPLASFALSYNGVLLAGFLNFLFGAGLALLAAALWVYWIDRKTVIRVVIVIVIAPTVYFAHLTALLFLAALLFCIEASISIERRRVVAARIAAIAIVMLPVLMLAAAKPMVPMSPEDGWSSGLSMLIDNPLERMRNLVTPFLTYDILLDVVVLAAFLATVGCALRNKLFAASPGLALLAVAMLLVFPAVPTTFLGTGWVDRRVPVFAVLIAFAAFDPGACLVRWRRWLVTAIIVVAAGRVGFVAYVWADWEAGDRSDLVAAAAEVEPLKRVLVVRAADRGHPRLIWTMPRARQIMVDVDAAIHWPALPLIARPAFIPLLHTSHQPIAVRSSFACLAVIEGQPPSWRALVHPTDADLRSAPYLADWQNRFDYVLLVQAGRVLDSRDPLPGRLRPIVVRDGAALYRIIHPDGKPGWAPSCPHT